jgi:Tol biopolymer transport system component
MSGHDRHFDQHAAPPELLDAYWNQLRQGDASQPPAGLHKDLAALAAALERELHPPEPTPDFQRALRQRLLGSDSLSSPDGMLLPPAMTTLPQPPPPPPLPPHDAQLAPIPLPRRRRWLQETGKFAAGLLVFVLVAGVLIALFGTGDRGDGTPTPVRAVSGPTATPALPAPGVAQGSAPTAHVPPAAQRPGELLITWDPTGGPHHKLYILSTDGSEPRKLTPGPGDDLVTEIGGDWSPDGTRIAFAAGTEGSWQIYVIDADDREGSSLRPVGPTFNWVEWPRWSPDATRLLFAGQRDGSPGIFTLDVSTAEVLKLTDTSDLYYSPTWSPNGARILYGMYSGGMARFGMLYSMNADGSDKRPLPGAIGFDPQWSPVDNLLAYTYQLRFGNYVLVLPADSMHDTPPDGMVTGVRLTAEGLRSWNPRWSPAADGRLAYAASDMGGSIAGIFLYDGLDTTHISDLTGNFEWSADGRQLAVITERVTREGQIDTVTLTLVNTDGSGERQLFSHRGLGPYLAWRPQPTPDAPNVVQATPEAPQPVATPNVSTTPDPPSGGQTWPELVKDLCSISYPPVFERGIFVVDIATGQTRTIVPTDRGIGEPAVWTPDGRSVTTVLSFTLPIEGLDPQVTPTADAHGNYPIPRRLSGIFLVDVATGAQTLLVETAQISALAWSPDGTQLAFLTSQTGAYGWHEPQQVWVVNADGSGLRNLDLVTPAGGHSHTLGWFPDGLRVAWVDGGDIWLLHEGQPGAFHNLTRSPEDELAPQFGLQGEVIFQRWSATGDDRDFPYLLYALPVQGGGAQPLDQFQRGDTEPQWTADGAWITVVRDGDIWVMRADGSDARNMTWHSAPEDRPLWSPDGSQVLFRSMGYEAPPQVHHRLGKPQPIVLRAVGQEQTGVEVVTCWSTSQTRSVTGTDALAFATESLVLGAGDSVQLDLTALGDVASVAVTVYDIAATRANGKGVGDDALILPCAAPGGSDAECRVLHTTLEPRPIIDFTLPLAPGDYVLVVQANIVTGDESGYVEQSFSVRVVP